MPGSYKEIQFTSISQSDIEILIALLSEKGFDGFQEEENALKAYIGAEQYSETDIRQVREMISFQFMEKTILTTNWNDVWESNFTPVIVDDFCTIRADFHLPITGALHEIIITPKMSFGTGHHATTEMMIRQMRQIDFAGKKVFDFGTGTGILAILAEKLGAASIEAIDNDAWSIENASENVRMNNCAQVAIRKSESPVSDFSYDIILANINKNVILGNISKLVKQLAADGVLVVSGLLVSDKEELIRTASTYHLEVKNDIIKDNWICVVFGLK